MKVFIYSEARQKLHPSEHGKKHQRKQRTYADKESFKWQRFNQSR